MQGNYKSTQICTAQGMIIIFPKISCQFKVGVLTVDIFYRLKDNHVKTLSVKFLPSNFALSSRYKNVSKDASPLKSPSQLIFCSNQNATMNYLNSQ